MIKDEFRVIIYMLALGIYLFSFLDLITEIKNKLINKKINKILIDFIYMITNVLLTYKLSYIILKGNIPFLFSTFIIMGILIYLMMLRNSYLKIVELITYKVKEKIHKIKRIILGLFVNKQLFKIIKKELIRYKKIFFKK